jgi:hypothetical protein
MSFGGQQMGGGAANPNNDFQVQNPPGDGISSLSWSPTSNFLVATSWDCDVLCYEVQANGQAMPKASIKHDAPVGLAHFTMSYSTWDPARTPPCGSSRCPPAPRILAWVCTYPDTVCPPISSPTRA